MKFIFHAILILIICLTGPKLVQVIVIKITWVTWLTLIYFEHNVFSIFLSSALFQLSRHLFSIILSLNCSGSFLIYFLIYLCRISYATSFLSAPEFENVLRWAHSLPWSMFLFWSKHYKLHKFLLDANRWQPCFLKISLCKNWLFFLTNYK